MPLRIILTLALMLAAPLALAADPLSIPAITLGTNASGQQEYSVSLQILLIMTALSFIPAFVMLMTSFTRIIIASRSCVRPWACSRPRRTRSSPAWRCFLPCSSWRRCSTG